MKERKHCSNGRVATRSVHVDSQAAFLYYILPAKFTLVASEVLLLSKQQISLRIYAT